MDQMFSALQRIAQISDESDEGSDDGAYNLLLRINSIALEALAQAQRSAAPPKQEVLPINLAPKAGAKLSPTMSKALEVMALHGRLVRWPGGFWTFPNCEIEAVQTSREGVYNIPKWYVSAQTVQALEARGLITLQKIAHRYPEVAYLV